MCSSTIKRLLCLLICFIFWFYNFPCFASKNGETMPLLGSSNSNVVIDAVQVQAITFDAATNPEIAKELIEFAKQQGGDINDPRIKAQLQELQKELEEYIKVPGSTAQDYIEKILNNDDASKECLSCRYFADRENAKKKCDGIKNRTERTKQKNQEESEQLNVCKSELHTKNNVLEKEKSDLEKRINDLEGQIVSLKKSDPSCGLLKCFDTPIHYLACTLVNPNLAQRLSRKFWYGVVSGTVVTVIGLTVLYHFI